MKYIAPTMKIEEAQAVKMMAVSLDINSDETVDGGNALAKEGNDWDIWGSEE